MQAWKKGGNAVLALTCLIVLAVGILLQYLLPISAEKAAETVESPVVINEIMATNASAIISDYGELADWFEVANLGSEPVNLRNYTVCENTLGLNAFVFPEHILEPGETTLVFADDRSHNTAGYVYHAPFRLQASGGRLILKNADGATLDDVVFPELQTNRVYYRTETAEWLRGAQYTPGMANTLENHQSIMGVVGESPVVVSEVMADNVSYPLGVENIPYDYIELFNTSDRSVSLEGYYLTDNRDDLFKWRFPDVEIPAYGTLLVYTTGFNGVDRGDLHADFKLNKKGEDAILVDPTGVPVSSVHFPAMTADQAYSLLNGEYTLSLAPTPGRENSVSAGRSAMASIGAVNTVGVIINELDATGGDLMHDWVELYNTSNFVVDLSGYGLSDETDKPRKFQFPQGTTIGPGEYLGVYLAEESAQSGLYAGFSIALDGGYFMTLSDPAGTVFERVYVPKQFGGVSYGRATDRDGFVFFPASTPLKRNEGQYFEGKAEMPAFTEKSRLYQNGEIVTVALDVPAGTRVYYTTDCTDPTEASTLYTGPFAINSNTIVRARAFENGKMPSYVNSQSYFFGLDHTMRVVSLVSDPDNFFGANGIYSNFREELECDGHVEVFTEQGGNLLTSLCGFALHGADSRLLDQKNFKVLGKSEYGATVFDAPLFSGRDYETYESFILRCSSEDGPKTRMRDSVLTSLMENTSVMYQETELCVVYVNGEYWGHYNMRERICTASICQFEGWVGQEDQVDLVRGNMTVVQGSDETYQNLLSWVKQNGVPDDAALEKVGEVIDLDNYIDYHAMQIFVGNADTLNVRRYRNGNADGKWRWVLYDLDWGFYVDTNSIGRWLAPGGMGAGKRTDNTLFIALMENDTFRDRFLTRMGEMMATDWTTDNVVSRAEVRYHELLPELPRQFARWNTTEREFNSELGKFVKYAETRPTKLLGYFQSSMNLTDAQMEHYFGAAMDVIEKGGDRS